MYSIRIYLVTIITIISFLLNSCVDHFESTTSEYETIETPYGTVSIIDDYQLYSLEYVSDYNFDQYLETGHFPDFTSYNSNNINFSCTCFSALGGDSKLLGRNFDWNDPAVYFILFTNPKDGYSSVSTVDMGFFDYDHNEPPNSVGNQNTLRMLPFHPFDGMNEMGVAIGMNAVPNAQSPYDPSNVTIGELQLIRLVLDYASSTYDAIDLIKQYNIRMENPPIHYLIADASGHSAIIEFINGEINIINNTNPWQVTTNFVINELSNHSIAPCWRYKLTYETLSANNGIQTVGEAVNLLENVSVPTTRWSTIYNMRDLEFQITVSRNYDNFHHFSIPYPTGIQNPVLFQ